MKVLVTGHLGLVGSEITSQLVAAGHTVVGLDDLSHNAIDPRESPAQISLTLPLYLAKIDQRCFGVEYVIHCASPVGHARLRPEEHIAWKIVSETQHVLEFCAAKKARLITMSSSEVLTYKGETDVRSQYALSKLTSEAMALAFPNVEAHVIRPYNVVGGRQRTDGGFVMPRFRDAIRDSKPLTIFGSGEQVRHFTHVSDFARFVLLLMEKWPSAKDRWCVFNPANGTNIAELARRFVRQADSPAAILPYHDGREVLNNPHWRDSSERALDMSEYEKCRALGWQPRVTLEEIVQDYLGMKAMAGRK